MNDQYARPADMLAQQIDRVSGLLRTLGEFYAPQSESFAAGNSFIAHGLVVATSLLDDAQSTLVQLQQNVEEQFSESPTPAILQEEPPQDQPMVFPPIENDWHTEDKSAEIALSHSEEPTLVVAPSISRDDEFAQSYLELLRKLTAAEVFAAEQQALAPPGSGQNLLPLLRSLREEFQKLHKVA